MWAKASAGLLLFALSPAYCLWSLTQQQKNGTLKKMDPEFIKRSFRNDGLFVTKKE